MQSSVYIVRLSRVGTRLTEYLETVNRKGKIVTRTYQLDRKILSKGCEDTAGRLGGFGRSGQEGPGTPQSKPPPPGPGLQREAGGGKGVFSGPGMGGRKGGGWCGFLPQASPPPRPDPITDPGRLS